MVLDLGRKGAEILFAEARRRGLSETERFILWGVRFSEDSTRDEFGDILGQASLDEGAFAYKGTTRPGIGATKDPVTYKGVTGAGWVVPGLYIDVYQLGFHCPNNPAVKHEAWRQVGKFKVARDTDRDGVIEEHEPVQEGDDTCINFHRASKVKVLNYIGPWGRACMVGQDAKDHEHGVDLWKRSAKYKADPAARVSFLLLTDEEALALDIIF